MTKNKKIVIYTDGGARGNPGPAGIGVVIYDQNKKLISEISQYLGEATNNQAEYQAVIIALEKAKKIGAEEINLFSDSELMISQLKGDLKVKNKELGSLFVKIWNLKQSFKKVKFHHLPRAENKRADQLVNQAIDEAEK